MAEDHRYSWLDDNAAERLLRGEPVEGQPVAPDGRGDQSYADAERLAAVLSAVAGAGRPVSPSDGPALPGEEAALAAFRAARVGAGAEAGTVAEMGMARRPHPIRRFRERQPRLRRPLRAGMVAVVAGCALSGFAVAAAAGVLPTPFGQSDHTPGPSVSMPNGGSGGDSAHPEISEDGGTTAPDPSGSGDNDASDVGSSGAQGGAVTPDPDGKDKNGDTKGPSSNSSVPGVPNWALTACPQYLAAESGSGTGLDKKSLKKLTKAAGSASAIHGYCTQILSDDSTGTPRSDENSGNGGGGAGGGSDNGDSGGSGDSGDSGDSGGSGEDAGSGSGGDSGGDQGKDGGDDGSVPQPPPPPADPTDTPSDATTPTPAVDSATSTDPATSGDPTTTSETGAGRDSGTQV
ncbi:hypothetical protein [Streptomyces malaysiensis]|uniref:hypothetical protein n=1 Tax=Streptomyces malaysiensis TaxID=92644 RepID=UPI0037241D9A